MSKRGKLKSYAEVKGQGNDCPNCHMTMQRRKRIKPPKNKNYFFTEWDYCLYCGHIQHYDEFKSSQWQEDERQQNFLSSI